MASREFLLQHHLQNRKLLRKILGLVNADQANIIPEGFNNNIIWNCTHVIAIQQTLVYSLCCKTTYISQEQINEFTIGTRPTHFLDNNFVEIIKNQLVDTSDKMAIDIKNEEFTVLRPFMTAIKVELQTIDEVLAFINYHEGLHLGVITALLKLVQTS